MLNSKHVTYLVCFLCIDFLSHHSVAQITDSKQKSFSITGISQKQNGAIALEYLNGNKVHFDTVDIQNGSFFFKGVLNEACLAVVSILDSRSAKNSKVSYNTRSFTFFLEPMRVTMKLDTSSVIPVIGGSKAQEDFYKLTVENYAISRECDLLYHQMMELVYKKQSG